LLAVNLVKARNLIKSDILGKSDPYALLKFGNQKERTDTIKNTLEPQWDHHAEFQVPDGGADKILVEVFDADKLGKDKSLGKAEIDVLDLAAGDGHWFPLQGNSFYFIFIYLQYFSDTEDGQLIFYTFSTFSSRCQIWRDTFKCRPSTS
jgi:hypothetical protein